MFSLHRDDAGDCEQVVCVRGSYIDWMESGMESQKLCTEKSTVSTRQIGVSSLRLVILSP